MKKLFVFIGLVTGYAVHAQKGDELLVYSLKGTVTVIENNQESKVKIGKVLKPGSTIKTQREAKLTMVCKEGKPLSVTKEGIFPVTRWKDSCTTSHSSVTSKYFQYIWDQLYVRSEDYKRTHQGESGAIVRSEAPVRGEEDLEIYFDEAFDTINYASGSFPLSWSINKKYPDKYYFVLLDTKGNKPLYKDSVSESIISIDKIRKYMKPGNVYKWTVSAKNTEAYEGGVINYILAKKVSQQVAGFQKLVEVPEDVAAQYFRIAYLLENSHYLPNAFLYYQKAVNAAPDVYFYREKLVEFKEIFRLK